MALVKSLSNMNKVDQILKCCNKEFIVGSWKKYKNAIIVGLLAVLVLSGIVLYSKMTKKKASLARTKEIQRNCLNIPESETIFVCVPSFRDTETAATLFDLFEKSACPFRITVGLCQQNLPGDVHVMTRYRQLVKTSGSHDFSNQIRILSMDAHQAKGPTYARHLIETRLYRNEKFYLCIDSHMCFVYNWDRKCVKNLYECPSRKPIVSFLPQDFIPMERYQVKKDQDPKPPTFMYINRPHRETFQVPELKAHEFKNLPRACYPSSWLTAKFLFTLGDFVKQVPSDPLTVFVPSELEDWSLSVRGYTHGWDVYTPMEMLAQHMYINCYKCPMFLSVKENQGLSHASVYRLRKLLGDTSTQDIKSINMDAHLDFYGLGQKRTLHDFYECIGYDLRNHSLDNEKHAFMGISSSNASSQEILDKYGSLAQYYYYLGLLPN